MATEEVTPFADASGISVGDNKRRKTMATIAEKVTYYADAPGIVVGDNKRRVLDVYYTGEGTKLFVENGVLVEESIQSSPLPPPQFSPIRLHVPTPLHVHVPTSFLPGISTSPPKINPPSHSYKAVHLEQNRRTAEAALEYYNSEHCAKFSLVNPISSCGRLLRCGIWLHCNFKAKPEGHEDSSAKLFFAEMKVVKSGNQFLVTECCSFDDDSKTTKDCYLCRSSMVHPTNGRRQAGATENRGLCSEPSKCLCSVAGYT